MRRIVIQTITVECVNQTSNKFYEVVLVVQSAGGYTLQ